MIGSAFAWPAPAARPASPWAAQAEFEALARARAQARPAVRPPAPRPTATPKPRPPATRAAAPRPTGLVSGVAMVFRKWMSPLPNEDFPDGLRVMYMPGALDRHLARVHAGRAVVPLCVDHDAGLPLCSTADDLHVWIEDGAVRFKVYPHSTRGRLVIGAMRKATRYREASASIIPTSWTVDRSDRLPMVVVAEGRLVEISLVPRGACPGAWALVS